MIRSLDLSSHSTYILNTTLFTSVARSLCKHRKRHDLPLKYAIQRPQPAQQWPPQLLTLLSTHHQVSRLPHCQMPQAHGNENARYCLMMIKARSPGGLDGVEVSAQVAASMQKPVMLDLQNVWRGDVRPFGYVCPGSC